MAVKEYSDFMINPSLTFLRFENVPDYKARFIADDLSKNTTLKTLEILGNTFLNNASPYYSIHHEGIVAIASSLLENTTLIELNIGYNRIGDKGAGVIVELLCRNTTLKKINLQSNLLSGHGLSKICNALYKNNSITSIDLSESYYHVNLKHIKSFSSLLEINKTLTSLHLARNNIRIKGAKLIAKGLKNNFTLTELDIGYNEIEDRGAGAIVKALEDNSTLISLNLEENSIINIFGEFNWNITNMFKKNKTLTHLDLRFNQINSETLKSIEEIMIQRNNEKKKHSYLFSLLLHHVFEY